MAFQSSISTKSPAVRRGTIRDYISLARFDHMTKHIFIVPGIVLAYAIQPIQASNLLFSIVVGLFSAICIASANYVINEWLDREFDAFTATALSLLEPAIIIVMGVIVALIVLSILLPILQLDTLAGGY